MAVEVDLELNRMIGEIETLLLVVVEAVVQVYQVEKVVMEMLMKMEQQMQEEMV